MTNTQQPFSIPADVMARIQETSERNTKLITEALEAHTQSIINHINTPTETVTIRTTADVTDEVAEVVADIYEGFYANDSRIDWDGFYDRLEKWGYCLETADSPAAWKIRRIVRNLRAEG